MVDAESIAESLIASFDACRFGAKPYRHWLPERMLPEDACLGLDALPVAPPRIEDTRGKRETHNSSRLFFGVEARRKFAACDALANALQSEAVVSRLEHLCDIDLSEAFLRVEYCLDTDGFWLEPHTDIGVKLFTMLIYLSNEPGSEGWGTDILDQQLKLVATTPYRRNAGLIFIPAADTWHGFHRRPIDGVRRSLIVNYVKPEWRNRHELAFPERMAGG